MFCMDNEQKPTVVFFGNNCRLACVPGFSVHSARFSWFFLLSFSRVSGGDFWLIASENERVGSHNEKAYA
jgi:hypothetical protein